MGEWQPIETAPKDGSWFVIWTHGEPEVGRYNPTMWTDYKPVGGGLFRAEEKEIYQWDGFNNFDAATHWMPLPEPPK